MTEETKACPYCGEQIIAEAQKCKHCGEWLTKRYGKSWVKTYLLGVFLGIFGAHNFYNRKIGIGIAQLLTLGGLGIWWLVDMIMILCNAYRDADGLKLSKEITKTSTALIWITGAHRFYTENFGTAWLLAFSYIIYVGYIWWIVDLILILTNNFKDGKGNLIKD